MPKAIRILVLRKLDRPPRAANSQEFQGSGKVAERVRATDFRGCGNSEDVLFPSLQFPHRVKEVLMQNLRISRNSLCRRVPKHWRYEILEPRLPRIFSASARRYESP